MRFITGIALVLIIGIVGYLLYASFQPVHEPLDLLPLVKEETPEVEETLEEKPPALWMEKAEISLVDYRNRLCWQLTLNTGEREEEFYFLQGVEGKYFPPAGGFFSVRAERGRITKEFSHLRLEGKVVLSREDLTIEMEELEWEITGACLYGKKMVLSNKEMAVYADRIQLDLDLERIRTDGTSRWKLGGG